MKTHNRSVEHQREIEALFAAGPPSGNEKPNRRGGRVFLLAVVVVFAAACLVLLAVESVDRRPFRMISYNVQNLFDGTDDGDEYREFRPESGYTSERYWARLEQLSRVIASLSRRPPDALLLIELEDAGVAADLAAHFFGSPFARSAGVSGTTTTSVVLLTREAPGWVSIHAAAEYALVPGRRPRRIWRGRDAVHASLPKAGYTIYGAHWKSQSGGESETERYRLVEARLARSVVGAVRQQPTLLVGDLNENLHEFEDHSRAYATALMPAEAAPGLDGGLRFVDHPRANSAGESTFRSLWHTARAPGSYFYRERWERLDHAFLFPGDTEVVGRMEVGSGSLLTDPEGRPRRYDPRSGRGVSDHLPILIELSRSRIR